MGGLSRCDEVSTRWEQQDAGQSDRENWMFKKSVTTTKCLDWNNPKGYCSLFQDSPARSIQPIRQALRECLVTSAILMLSLVRSSVREELAVERLAQRLIRTLKVMGITHIPGFDIFGSTRVENEKAKNCELRERKIFEYVVSRMKVNMRVTQNSHAGKWYGDTIQ